MSFDVNIVKSGGRYTSCEWLRRGIYIFNTGLYNCCVNRVIGEYEGDPYTYKLPLLDETMNNDTIYDSDFFDNLFAKKIDYIKKLNDGIKCECTGCHLLETKEWEPIPDLKMTKFLIAADYNCNANCVYCEQDHALCAKYDFYNFIKAGVELGYIDTNPEDGSGYVLWSGGEPTLMRNYQGIVDFFKGKIDLQIFLSTCITFDENIAQHLEHTKTGNLILSIDSGNRETYKKIKRVDQFDRVLANFKKYYDRTKYKNRIILKYILREENCSEQEIDSFLNMIKDNGLYGISVIIATDFFAHNFTDKVRAGIYYLTLRVPLVARCRPYFCNTVRDRLPDIEKKLRMPETFYHRLLLHKIEDKGLDIQDIIQYVREL